MKKQELPWLKVMVREWDDRLVQGRAPHAILLLGQAGTGKRCAAAWLAGRHLGMAQASVPAYPLDLPQHPDLRWLRPPEDKQAIGIDAVRELVVDLALTSHSGGGKVAVIEPADAMTGNAANALLKTLEEPPGNALLILVVDRAGRLPATITSRCQRIDIAVPSEAEGLAWLNRIRSSADWMTALRQALNAPLRALREAERSDDTASLLRDFSALAGNGAMPVETAARWMRFEIQYVLDWLCREVQYGIRRSFGDRTPAETAITDSVLQRMDRRKMFCYLDTINRIRHQAVGSYNVQLTLESLLIDWADGLRDCRSADDTENTRLNFAR